MEHGVGTDYEMKQVGAACPPLEMGQGAREGWVRDGGRLQEMLWEEDPCSV